MAFELAEKDIVRQCSDLLKHRGWRVINYPVGVLQRPGSNARIRVGEVGAADKICIRPVRPGHAHVFFLEFKRPGGKLSQAQAEWHEYMKKLGYLTVAVDSLDGLQGWLREFFLP